MHNELLTYSLVALHRAAKSHKSGHPPSSFAGVPEGSKESQRVPRSTILQFGKLRNKMDSVERVVQIPHSLPERQQEDGVPI